MPTRSAALAAAMLFGCAALAAAQQSPAQPPAPQGPKAPAPSAPPAPSVPWTGASPVLDGDMSRWEWAAARRIGRLDSVAVYLMRDRRFLYVAVRTHFPSVGSLCVQRGDTVRVLHASAALGTAVYARDPAAWHRVAPFVFRVRERDMSREAQAGRADFLASDGWVATTAYMGSRNPALEFRIRLELLDPADRRLAVASRNMSNRDPAVTTVPAGLADGCADHPLVAGDAPETLVFDPTTWLRLRLPAPRPRPPADSTRAVPASPGTPGAPPPAKKPAAPTPPAPKRMPPGTTSPPPHH